MALLLILIALDGLIGFNAFLRFVPKIFKSVWN